jgi:hypothetical protein
MDLSTVLNNILAGRYSSEDMVRADLSLIWENCTLYLGPKHQFSVNARSIKEEVEMLWKTLPASDVLKPTTPTPVTPTPKVVDFEMRQRVMMEIEKLQDKDPDGMGDLLDVIQKEAPAAVKTIEGETVLDFEAFTDYGAMKRIEAFVSSKLSGVPDPKRRKI